MKYSVITSIAILVMSVATATLAMSLLSQPASAICAGFTCASTDGRGGALTIGPGFIAGTKASTTGEPGTATGDGTGASSGSIFCNGKPAARINGQITCSP